MTWEMLNDKVKRNIPRDFFLLDPLENFSCARVWVLQSGRKERCTKAGRATHEGQ